jgi:hypothetical protein
MLEQRVAVHADRVAGTAQPAQHAAEWRATVDEDGQYSFAIAL